MNIEDTKPDWVGTPRKHSYTEDGNLHTAISIDFSLSGDDSRYKLVMHIEGENKRYEIKQYGTALGAQKPFLKDTDYRYENKTTLLIDAILSDPYVQHFL